MKMRVFLAMMASMFLVAGCFSSSSDDDDPSSDLSDRDRAEAAASASILSGALDNPDDDDDDDDGGFGPMSGVSKAARMASDLCDSGSVDEGETPRADVGSPYTDDGRLDITWRHFQGCVQGNEEFEMTTDGYQAQQADWDSDVNFFRWAATPDDPMGSEGEFVMDSSFGAFRFSGYMHECEGENCLEPNQFGTTGYVDWNIESQDEEVQFAFGRSGDDPMVTEGEWVSATDAVQSIDGFYALNWVGTECDIEVGYETIEPLYFADFQTSDEQVMSGRMNMEINDSSFEIEFIDGQAFIDGEEFDPDDDNPCAGAFDIGFGF